MPSTRVLVLFAIIAASGIFIFYQSISWNTAQAPVAAITTTEDYSFELISPEPTARVQSPLVVRGRARGSWFSNDSFPVQVLDNDGDILSEGKAVTMEKDLTERFVPFEGKVTFERPRDGKIILVFRRASTSGLLKDNKEFRVRLLVQ